MNILVFGPNGSGKGTQGAIVKEKYKTPHIDRIAKEGMKFTDYYAEQSCTAGRSAFSTASTRSEGMAPGATSASPVERMRGPVTSPDSMRSRRRFVLSQEEPVSNSSGEMRPVFFQRLIGQQNSAAGPDTWT